MLFEPNNHFTSQTPQFADEDNEGERRGHVGNPMSGRKWSRYEEELVVSEVRPWEQGEDGVGQPIWPDETEATSLIYAATLSNALYQDSLSFTPGQGTGGTVVKNLPPRAGDMGSITRLGRSPGVGNGKPLQHSCLENSMDRGDWKATVHGVTKNLTQLSMHTHTHTHTNAHRVFTACVQALTHVSPNKYVSTVYFTCARHRG